MSEDHQKRITPRYALILLYDVKPGMIERYFRFISGQMWPLMQEREVYLQSAWQILYGEAPDRQIEFVTEEKRHLITLFNDAEYQKLEERLLNYVDNYQRLVIPYTGSFKIIAKD